MRPEQTKPRHVSPAHRTMGYRPAVKAQRQSTARDRPALQTETGAEAFKDTLIAHNRTSVPTRVPRRDASSPKPARTGIRTGRRDTQPLSAPPGTHDNDINNKLRTLRSIAARLHDSHSHGQLSSMPGLCCGTIGLAPSHPHEFDEALIARAAVSLIPGIVSR